MLSNKYILYKWGLLTLFFSCILTNLTAVEVQKRRYTAQDFSYTKLAVSPNMQGAFKKRLRSIADVAAAGNPNKDIAIAKLSYSGWISRKTLLDRYKSKAQKGDPDTQYRYALLLLENNCGEESPAAISMLKSAANRKYAPAIFLLGECYKNATGCFTDYNEAAKWYSLLLKDPMYSSQSKLALAYCYIQTKKFADAETIISPLLKDNNARAFYLKYKLIRARNPSLKKIADILNSEAMQICKKAASIGDLDAACEYGTYCLYSAFSENEAHKKLVTQVPHLLKNALEANHSEAYWLMSQYYGGMNGTTPKDGQKAFEYYLKAAEYGNLYCRFEIATFEIEMKNPERALQWLRPGILKKDINALFLAGSLLARGKGIEKDSLRAFTYLNLAKQLGYNATLCDNELALLTLVPIKSKQQVDDSIVSYKEYEPAPHSSFSRFLDIIATIQDSTNSFEEVESKLSRISPKESRVGTETVTADEMDFLLTLFKLEYCSILRKGRKTIIYAEQLEYILKQKDIDIDKLSRFLWGINLYVMKEVCLARAEIIKSTPENAIPRIKTVLATCAQDSPEYQMAQYTLMCLYIKQKNASVSNTFIAQSLKEIADYFIHNRLNAYAAIVISQLPLVEELYSERQFEYLELSRELALETNSDLIYSVYLLRNMFLMCGWYYAPDELKQMSTKQKNSLIEQFESYQNEFMKVSTSDYYIVAGYFYSILFKQALEYPTDDILHDIEKYFLYKSLLFEAVVVGNSVEDQDNDIVAIKNEILKKLAEQKNTEKLNFWNIQFEKIRLRENATNTRMSILARMVSRLENANQILMLEKNKKSAERDSKLILMASEVKNELEKYFDTVRYRLSIDEQKKLDIILTDSFIINPNALHQLSSILPQDVVCVQIIPVGDNLISYLTSKDSIPFVHITSLKSKGVSEKKLKSLIIQMRSLLQVPGDAEQLKKILKKLYFIIWDDLQEPINKLEAKKIIVNSSGFLRYIPFAALHTGNEYLIEKYQITNVTGLDLIRLSSGIIQREYTSLNAVIFADPDGSLPAARREGKVVANLFKNTKFHVGKDASLESFESLLGDVNFIHLATHAVLNPNVPEESYILFSKGEHWHYADMNVFNIKNVDSFVLSACATAIAEKNNGSEIEGMAYKLLCKSPAGSVLASFWKVDDDATAKIMAIYYTHIVESCKRHQRLDRGGALRKAQLNLLKENDTNHPYYWAAFTLFGDFR